jgi:hypothetical protein
MPTNQRSVAEGRAQAVACLGEVHECLSRFLKNLGGIDPATAEDLVEVIGTELGEMGQQFIKTFSGALAQGRNVIAQASGGPQSLGDPLARRPEPAVEEAAPEDDEGPAAALLQQMRG